MGKVIELFKWMGEKQMEKGTLDAREVAKVFLSIESMSNKKLQKLCYYAQAWSYALLKKGLFYQDIEAWVHGPVITDIYDKYRHYRWKNIPKEQDSEHLGNDIYEFLREIYDTYGEFSGDELETLTHSEKPWQIARDGLEEWEPSHNKIDPKVMSDYYWSLYEPGER